MLLYTTIPSPYGGVYIEAANTLGRQISVGRLIQHFFVAEEVSELLREVRKKHILDAKTKKPFESASDQVEAYASILVPAHLWYERVS
jgi:hypothetical protein